MRQDGGFTLVEMVIAVAVVAILAAVVIPQFSMMLRRTNEATTKGNLAIMRGAIASYIAINAEPPLDDLTSLVAGGHINKIPDTFVKPWHQRGNHVGVGDASAQLQSSGDVDHWWYSNVPSESDFGKLEVNCIHQDLKGSIWTSY